MAGGKTILEHERKHIPGQHAQEVEKALKGVDKAKAIRRKFEGLVENSDNPSAASQSVFSKTRLGEFRI